MRGVALFTTRKRRIKTIGWLGILILLGAALLLRVLMPKPAEVLRAFLFGEDEAVEEALTCWKSGVFSEKVAKRVLGEPGGNRGKAVCFARVVPPCDDLTGTRLLRERGGAACVPR